MNTEDAKEVGQVLGKELANRVPGMVTVAVAVIAIAAVVGFFNWKLAEVQQETLDKLVTKVQGCS